jgi:hypothetical protein
VLSYAALRRDREAEILSQIDSQLAFWQALFPWRLTQLPLTQEIMTAVTQFAVFVEMRFKHDFACRRPIELSPQVQPMITTPGHGTFPMGHATQIFALRRTLTDLMEQSIGPVPGNLASQMMRFAYRASENRVVAGVHFPVDLAGGAVLGEVLGGLAVRRFSEKKEKIQPLAAPVQVDQEPIADILARPTWLEEFCATTTDSTQGIDYSASPILQHMWTEAIKEVRAVAGLPITN